MKILRSHTHTALSLFILLVTLSRSANICAQTQDKIRSLNLGILANYGLGINPTIDDLGYQRALEAYTPTQDDNGAWRDENGNNLDLRATWAYGARLHFQSQGENGNIWDLGFSFQKAQVSAYFENLFPFYWPDANQNITDWHWWLNYHNLNFEIGRARRLGDSNGSFIYLNMALGFSKLSPQKFEQRRGNQVGIVGDGMTNWVYEGTGATFTNQVKDEYVPMLTPEVGFQFNMGKRLAATLRLGVRYTLPYSDLVHTDYTYYENYLPVTVNRIRWDGEYAAAQASLTVPLLVRKSTREELKRKRENRKRDDSSPKPPKTPRRDREDRDSDEGSSRPSKRKESKRPVRAENNIVLLVDVSENMDKPDKWPSVKKAFLHLLAEMPEQDRISVVVFSGTPKVALRPTPAIEEKKISVKLESLRSGNELDLNKGLDLAYEIAEEEFITGGNNKVILFTDGQDPPSEAAIEKAKSYSNAYESIQLSVFIFDFGGDSFNELRKLSETGKGNFIKVNPRILRNDLGDEVRR